MRQLSTLSIFASRLDRNLKKIHQLGGSKKIIPMLKANAYGHDLSLMAHFIDNNYENDFIDTLGVACFGEAEFLRKIIKVQKRIFVFSDYHIDLPRNQELMLDFGIIPVISNTRDLETFLKIKSFKYFPLVLKFNTGMNRLGFNKEETSQIIKLLKKHDRLELEHVMSHLGCSYLVDHEMNPKQIENFRNILNELKAEGISWKECSLFNSGAIEQNFSFEEATHVRPGIMMYGPQSTMSKNNLWDGEIISNLETGVIDARNIVRGEFVGYGATEVKEDGGLLVLAMGYGDGLLPKLQNFSLSFENKKVTFLGRINMDLSTLWINDKNPEKFRGKTITLWDNNQKEFNTLVKHLGTHPYDVFCSITSRVPRKFLIES